MQEAVSVTFEQFTKDGSQIELALQGHKTLFSDKGKNGSLFATVRVVEETERWREGLNVHSSHFISLSDALAGCKISVPTVKGTQQVEL